MEVTILIVIALILLGVCIMLLVRNYGLREELRRVETEKSEAEEICEQSDGLEEYHEKRRKKKEEKKEQIRALLRTDGTIQNRDIVKLLDISSATATRYLDELEEEGRIRQKGSVGRSVTYEMV